MKKSIIKVNNMTFKYNDKNIFKNFNLEIKEGEFVTVIGKNGSGKTTLAKILIGLYKSDGYITIDGYLLNNYYINKIRRVFSVCLGSQPFIGETVRDDLAFTLENLEYSKKEIEKLISIISKKFKIEDLLDKSPNELNSGEKVKVLIAASLIHNPKIILLDEMVNKLIPSDKKLIFKILKEYQEKTKLTIILVTHNLEDTLYSDRIILLDNGKKIYDYSKEEMYKDDKLEKLGFNLPFIVKLSQNLMLYNLLDKVYFDEKEVVDKLWQ